MVDTRRAGQHIFRGPQPEGGADIGRLKMMGVETVLCLRSWNGPAIIAERAEVEAAGMAWRHIPLSPVLPPSEEDLHRVAELMQTWSARKQTGYVHCLYGEDRTGFAVAAWKMLFLGQPYPLVLGDLIANGFHLGRFFWWLPTLRRLAASAGRL